MFSWEGVKAVAGADERLADAVHKEMEENGDGYSRYTKAKADGLVGFFGSRANAAHAIEWTEGKFGEAREGVAEFIAEQDCHSVDDVRQAAGEGLLRAGTWLGGLCSEASEGLTEGYEDLEQLGGFGLLNAAAGYASVAGAYGVDFAHDAWEGARDKAGTAVNRVTSSVRGWFDD